MIEGVDNTASTPDWMARKLLRANQQLHSPIVDITNYVLLELGQPMHAFDLSKINGSINVRSANKNEDLELLNGQSVTLSEDTLVIADEKSAIAIAGVIGGMGSSTLEYILVVGDREQENNQVSVRRRGGEDLGSMSLEALTELINQE